MNNLASCPTVKVLLTIVKVTNLKPSATIPLHLLFLREIVGLSFFKSNIILLVP